MMAVFQRLWRNFGLQGRMALTQAVLLVLSVSSISVYMAHRYLEELKTEDLAKTSLLLDLASPVVVEQVVIGDYAAIRELLERQARAFPQVERITWTSNAVEKVAATNADLIMREYPDWFDSIVGTKNLVVSRPLEIGGVHYGELNVFISEAGLTNTMWRIVKHNILIVGVGLLAVLVALGLIFRTTLKNLKALSRGATEFSQGNRAVRVSLEGAPELRNVAEAFNMAANHAEELLGSLCESQAALKKELSFTNALFDTMPLAMYVKGVDGVYTRVNRAWEMLFGIKREEMVGKKLDFIFRHDPEVARFHEEKDRILIDGDGVQKYHMWITTPDKRQLYVMYAKTMLLDESGTPTNMVGIIVNLPLDGLLGKE